MWTVTRESGKETRELDGPRWPIKVEECGKQGKVGGKSPADCPLGAG